MSDRQDNWKAKTLIASTVLGAGFGLVTGYLLNRSAEESGNAPPQVSTADGIKALVGIIGIVRGIVALGSKEKKD